MVCSALGPSSLRRAIQRCSLIAMLLAGWSGASLATGQTAPAQTSLAAAPDPVALPYPYFDTANSRWFYFSSAARPFGMVSLFPDTAIDGEWGSGYHYDAPTVQGFNPIAEFDAMAALMQLLPRHLQLQFTDQNRWL